MYWVHTTILRKVRQRRPALVNLSKGDLLIKGLQSINLVGGSIAIMKHNMPGRSQSVLRYRIKPDVGCVRAYSLG